jgi:hypothetical protein
VPIATGEGKAYERIDGLLKQMEQEALFTPAGAAGMSPKESPREKKM